MGLDALLKWLTNQIGGILGDSAKTLFANRRVALLISTGFVVLAISLGWYALERADFYQRILEASLSKNTENTPQTYKALESLILVDAESDADNHEIHFTTDVANAAVNPAFAQIIKEFDEAFSSKKLLVPQRSLVIAKPELTTVEGRPKQEEAIITEVKNERDVGFLFLPVRLLHVSDTTFEGFLASAPKASALKPPTAAEFLGIRTSSASNQGEPFDDCEASASVYCDDILTTRAQLGTMKRATGTAVTKLPLKHLDLEPAQVYVITENGLNRIVGRGGGDSTFYRNQFHAATVFQARPYYLGAQNKIDVPKSLLEGESPNGKIGDYFYVSQPYLDIGGNGMVVTIARAYQYPGHARGAICFDLQLNEQLGPKLRKFVDRLGGHSAFLTCTKGDKSSCVRTSPEDQSAGKTTSEPGKEEAELAESAGKTIAKSLNDASAKGGFADVVGNFFLNSNEDETPQIATYADILHIRWLTKWLVHQSQELQFTVPLGPPRLADNNSIVKIEFLAASLDIGKYLQTTATIGAIALTILGIALTIIVGSWATEAKISEAQRALTQAEIKEKQDLHTALDNVSNVMLMDSTPYVRLDDKDYIMDGNPALAELLGLPGDQASIDGRLLHTRFEDWLADRNSVTEYHRIQKLREDGKPVTPYFLSFRTVSGDSVRRKVVSSIVPASQQRPGSLPETFGILVS